MHLFNTAHLFSTSYVSSYFFCFHFSFVILGKISDAKMIHYYYNNGFIWNIIFAIQDFLRYWLEQGVSGFEFCDTDVTSVKVKLSEILLTFFWQCGEKVCFANNDLRKLLNFIYIMNIIYRN